MLKAGKSPSDPAVAKGLKYLENNIQPDGGIYGGSKSFLKNYETCVAVLCLTEANKDKKYDKAIKDADKYLRGLQIGGEKSNVEFGGVGYGGKGRPDLSNTHFLIEALTAAGATADDQAIQDALVFVSRCQNLESPHNTTPNAGKINDGGFYYTLQSAVRTPIRRKATNRFAATAR
ncbi:MAG: terpene cyclase/mutase family protein [Pirellulales bacterium]